MTPTTPGAARVELAIGGMTCASCAARIEKKLNRMEGVEATVNYATEKARVAFAEDVSVDDLIATVEATGYTAQPCGPAPSRARGHRDTGRRRGRGRARRRRAAVAAPAPRHRGPARRAGRRDGDDPGPPVRVLAVAVPHAGRPGRHVRRLAFPPRRLDQRQARRGHDGHPDLGRHVGRVPVVAVGAVLRDGRDAGHDAPLRVHDQPGRRGGEHLSGGRRRSHGVHPGRPVLRGPLQAQGGRGPQGAHGAGGQGGHRGARGP